MSEVAKRAMERDRAVRKAIEATVKQQSLLPGLLEKYPEDMSGLGKFFEDLTASRWRLARQAQEAIR